MTIQEIASAALARVAEYGANYPGSTASLVRRMSVRQAELFSLANRINPDYFGVCATAPVPHGGADLKLLIPPAFPADLISRIEIHDPGTSTYEVGEEVQVVSFSEKDGAFPPRVTLRDMTIRQVGTDLAGVAEIEVFYSRLPLPLPFDNPDYELEVTTHFQELLVLDLAKYVLRRASNLEGENRTAAIAEVVAEEEPLLGSFGEHVQSFSGAQIQRFATRTTKAAP